MIVRAPSQVDCQPAISCEIAAAAEARLRESPHTALRGISCKAEQGVLILEGRLKTFYHTQMAQEIVGGIEGVVQVVNRIEVVNSNQKYSDNKAASR